MVIRGADVQLWVLFSMLARWRLATGQAVKPKKRFLVAVGGPTDGFRAVAGSAPVARGIQAGRHAQYLAVQVGPEASSSQQGVVADRVRAHMPDISQTLSLIWRAV